MFRHKRLNNYSNISHHLRLLRGANLVRYRIDGINDAPALATANLGIAMGGAGTDVALETADIAIMSDDPTKVAYVIKLSQKAMGIIKQNIAFALIVKLVAVLLVFPGILNLWLAILADTGAALVVIANGMRLLKVKPLKN